MKNFVVNPFFYYSISFSLVLLLYTLKWSELYPSMTIGLSSFIVFTIFLSLFFLIIFNKLISKNRKIQIEAVPKKQVIYLLIFLILSLTVEFLYHGLIPLVLIAQGITYDYTEFGIPVFHVFLLSYVTLLGLIYFYRYLIFRNKYYLLIFFFSIVFSLLIVNRGTLIFILLSAIIAYSAINLSIIKITKVSVAVLVAVLIFGVLGNLRMISSGYKDQDVILNIGQASEGFLKTDLPSEVFWTYLYITSPYANLENEVQKRSFNNYYNLDIYLNYEILPDFISKRTDFENSKSNLLTEELNVRTMYGGAINKMGYIGAYGIYFWYVFAIFVTPILVRKEFFFPTIILLSTLSSFLMFDNVLKFSGFVFQFFILIFFSHFKFKQITIL